MAERLAQHKHCPTCGLAMGPKREACGDACAATLAEKLRKRRLLMFVWISASVIMIAAAIVAMK